jgi:hypothetical protein
MGRKPTAQHGVAPRERPRTKTPKSLQEVPRTPRGNPIAQASVLRPHVSRPPKPHPVGRPPNPRRPKVVRDIDGGAFLDLFRMFPDLPWPHHSPGNTAPGRDAALGRMARRALKRRVR